MRVRLAVAGDAPRLAELHATRMTEGFLSALGKISALVRASVFAGYRSVSITFRQERSSSGAAAMPAITPSRTMNRR